MILLALLLQLSSPSFADQAPAPAPAVKGKFKPTTTAQVKDSIANLSIVKGTSIEIYSYDAASDTFQVSLTKEPAVGPNVVTSEDLYKALGIEHNFKEFMRRKKDLMGSEFLTKEKLHLLQPSDVEKRKQSLPK